jgi:hypothetical protein
MRESAKDEAQWFPSAFPLWELHSCGSCKRLEPWLEGKTSTKLGPQDTIRKVLKRKWFKCPRIVHLNLICMSYDQKKGQELNWELDSQLQIPWKESNEVQLEHVIHCWKNIFKGYNILTLHFQKRFDLRKIWTFKIWRQQESQFWDSHLGVLGKSNIWM